MAAAVREATLSRHVGELGSPAYEGRGAGYPGEARAAAYVAREMQRLGLAPAGDPSTGAGSADTPATAAPGGRSFLQRFAFPTLAPPSGQPGLVLRSANVLGVLAGADPALRAEVVVIGAHLDGMGKLGQADPGRRGADSAAAAGTSADSVFASADDNTSGVGAVLAVAEALVASGVRPRRTVLFAAFGAEEPGLAGSFHYVAHPAVPLARHAAMLNLEKLGREPELTPLTTGAGTSAVWAPLLARTNAATGLHVQPYTLDLIADSDHYPFGAAGVPAMVLGVGYDGDTHRRGDTADKVAYGPYLARVRYVARLLVELADLPAVPAFTGAPTGGDAGLQVGRATPEEVAAAGLPATAHALKVLGVADAGRGGHAGVRPGDLVVEVAGKPIGPADGRGAINDRLAERVGRDAPTPVTVVRGRQRLTLNIPY